MALSESRLSNLLQQAFSAVNTVEDSDKLKDICDAMASAIVEEVKAGDVIIPGGSSAGTYKVT